MYAVRRVSPWSAARAGGLVGVGVGFIGGLVLMNVSSVLSPLLSVLDQPVVPLGWQSALLISLLSGGFLASICIFAALLYNLCSFLGASIIVELESLAVSRDFTHTPDTDTTPGDSSTSEPLDDGKPSFIDV